MLNVSQHIEFVLWDDWYPVGEMVQLRLIGVTHAMLFGVPLTLTLAADGSVTATGAQGPLEHVVIRYGLVSLSLGTPTRDIVDLPETRESDRVVCTVGSVAVAVSGLRAVENFLDLGHLAFVHTGYLGEEPRTKICAYNVESLAEGGVLATQCRVYPPTPPPMNSQGFDVDYTFAVRRPYNVALFKTNPVEKERMDMNALLTQPVTEERCVPHIVLAYPPHNVDVASLRWYRQLIFDRDRSILESKIPKRLPLDPRSEISVGADSSSAHYRRWLSSIGVGYGAIPLAAAGTAGSRSAPAAKCCTAVSPTRSCSARSSSSGAALRPRSMSGRTAALTAVSGCRWEPVGARSCAAGITAGAS